MNWALLTNRKLRRGLVAIATAVTAAIVLAFFLLLAALSGGGSCGGGQSGPVGGKGVPAKLIPVYQAAAQAYHLGPTGPSVLAAINRIETDFGRNLSTSSAGAGGWMQFIPSTWATYGVDGNHDGRKDPNNPFDAIFAAANYLRASGAPGSWHNAIFAYNHAEWYVADVLSHAQQYARDGGLKPGSNVALADTPGSAGSCGDELAVAGTYVFPIPRGVSFQWQRIDMGRDMQAPYGTPLLAIGDGIITSASGYFPCSTVLRLTDGPMRGRSIYYGHSGTSRYPAGTRVRVGQQISYAKGGSSCAAGGLSGWMEIGWANGTAPAANYCQLAGGGHCAGATPEGRSFSNLLQQLYQARSRVSPTKL